MREAVEYYGSQGWMNIKDSTYNNNWNNKKGPFFSGMNNMMVIPEIMIRLNGPCSSSKTVRLDRFTEIMAFS